MPVKAPGKAVSRPLAPPLRRQLDLPFPDLETPASVRQRARWRPTEEPQSDTRCSVCGTLAECQPYGPRKRQRICYGCSRGRR